LNGNLQVVGNPGNLRLTEIIRSRRRCAFSADIRRRPVSQCRTSVSLQPIIREAAFGPPSTRIARRNSSGVSVMFAE
jgi:hypothetical protein